MNKKIFLFSLLLISSCSATSSFPEYSKTGRGTINHFKTKVRLPKEKIVICALGDTGTGEEGQREVARSLKADSCTHILHLGDIIYPFGIKSDTDPQLGPKFFDHYGDLLEGGTELLLTMGNHDRYFRGVISPWLKLAKKHKNLIYPQIFYSYQIYDLCIFSIDTNRFFKEQKAWLKKALKTKGCRIKIGMTHFPFASSGRHGRPPTSIRNFLKNNLLGKLDMLFSGHDHNLADEGVFLGTRQIISGAGAKTRSLRSQRAPFVKSMLGHVSLRFREGKWRYFFKNTQTKTQHEGIVSSKP